MDTNGLLNQEPEGTDRTEKAVKQLDKELSELRSEEIKMASPMKEMEWNLPSSTRTPGSADDGNGTNS